jgi:hypothetical protein
MAAASSEDPAAAFAPLRPSLVRFAYRMLGSVAEVYAVIPVARRVAHKPRDEIPAVASAPGIGIAIAAWAAGKTLPS